MDGMQISSSAAAAALCRGLSAVDSCTAASFASILCAWRVELSWVNGVG